MKSNKATVLINEVDSWLSYNLNCEKVGKEDDYYILHPLKDENPFTSIRTNSEEYEFLDADENKYELEEVYWWLSENEIQIYGQSDDLIEICGSVRKELYANYNEPTCIRINNTIIKVTYDGNWELNIIESKDSIVTEKLDESSHCDYSELLRIGFEEQVESVEKLDETY